ncbi:msx2-interacting protein isoform X2 [Pseudoliparis swirei]|uniref:msx2-interacting protein isoform X2 n=1 Tax=Pseudoliparis swirei TaxID=2059687 RepID=UPI0024BE970D|nr:msx2-interacting protein isoform X2 [Pseudoliparis swirei]
MVRETRHLWVGNLPEHVREEKIVEHFKRYGRVESVKVLRKRGSEGGVAAFVDFVDIKSAQKAHNAVNKMGDRDLRTDYNEPGSVPSAVRGLEDGSPSSSRDVTGFTRGTVGPVFGPPVSLHIREGRYERRIDGSESRERAYDHSPYGHHERSGTFDRQRHYNADYYRDRSMFAAAGPGSSAIAGSFEASDPHFDSRVRDPFTLTNSTRRDLYRDDRGRRVDRTYHHRRSRSSHSSQSRHPSPQRTTGQTPKTPHSPKRAPVSPGRGPRSRSHSRSSSSDSVSSTSSTGSGSDSNSSSSDGSRAHSVQSSATHAPTQSSIGLDSDEPRRSFGIKVQNLPVRSTDTSLKDGLFHEFKKHGKVTSVQIHGATEDRYGLVFFRQQEDQEKALTVSKGKLFFGMLIEVTAWNGPETESENEFRPLDGRIDEFHPKATRTLFIGNLEKTTSYQQLLDIFQRFGEIVDIDIKKVNGVPQYAFVQYSDIASVCKAIKKMDGEYLGSNRLKLGFGKSMPTTCVWLDGLATSVTEQYLTRHFCRYGHVMKVVFDRLKGMALILYNNTDFAQAAVRETKGWKIGGNKIKVDFASQESQMAFYRSMQTSGQDIRDFYEIPAERREERRPPYHEFTAERAYYENIRTPGIYPEEARRDFAARSRERFPELEHYQGEHFDPRFHEDPREYRDYRDPFEQDIRKYTYIQRERERERERFEADRSRWSPSHPRRPVTPTVSPSPSDRAPREAERRVYSQSSERSGSASSMSPPHFDKSEKTVPEPASKSDKSSQPDRVASAEKTKRAKRKEKGDKDKAEKIKTRKTKGQSPSNPLPETELEPGFDGGSGKGRVSDQDAHEKPKPKGDGDSLTGNQLPTAYQDSVKSERSEMSKVENSDSDGKNRLKKHLKADIGNDGKDSSVDSDRLAARKKRFADSAGRTIRQKRSRHEEEEVFPSSDFGASATYLKESDDDKNKDSQRRDSRLKADKSGTPKDGQEDLRGQREKSEGSSDPLESKRHPGHTSSRRFSLEGITDQSSIREQEHHAAFKFAAQNPDSDKSVKNKEDYVDIDLSQSYRKQMEQNRRLHQQQQQVESDKSDKPGSPHGSETEDMEHRSLVHEVGKPPEDVTDNFPSHKLKKLDLFEPDLGIKRERVYRSFRQKSEDPDWNIPSPGLQLFSHHGDEEFVDPSQKDLNRNEEKIHPELELLVKRTHNTQANKPNTPLLSVEEEQQKRWENRVKQDVLPDLNLSRSLGKNIHNRKRLEFGIWHDLEPGEVRSDSEEDRENKPHSPMPSTSIPFTERPRVDRFSDPKIAHLERNKFYSFALDQTITPDTKALLERAKSLSSSREDNWSFLDYDSHFASLRSRKDTEKVESAPRPTPSWYMKKKKIRSGSEDKLDDRKEDPKPEEQERRELFASRFLHSPVFELDSRRLQNLERKHEEPEHSLYQQQGIDGELDSGPVVLFHSRFLELTRLQQKNKTHQLPEAKVDIVPTDEVTVEKAPVQVPQALQSPEMMESIMEPEIKKEPEIKPISPAEELISELGIAPTSVTQSVVKDFPSPEETCIALNQPPDLCTPVSIIKEEEKEEVKESEPVVPMYHPLTEAPSHTEPIQIAAPEPSYSVDGCKPPASEGKLDITDYVKPLCTEKPCRRDSQEFVSISEAELDPETTQPEVPEANSPIPPSLQDEEKETHTVWSAVAEPEGERKLQISNVQMPIDDDTNDEPVSPQKEYKTKEMKSKKFKQSPAQVAPVPIISTSSSEKQATRKSERIDKEKLKRGSSPRAESKSTGKSPIHGSEPDMSEPGISAGRARRRNVKSVYATPVEDDAPVRSGKETESPRSVRKRGADKDATQHNIEHDLPAPIPTTKRGRPPKNRRLGDESSIVKVEKFKIDKDTDSNESEGGERVPRVSKGKTSPQSTKSSLNPMSTVLGFGSTRKGEKPEVADDYQEMDFTDEDSLPMQDLSSSCKEEPTIKVDQKKEEKDKQVRELGRNKDVFHEKACEGKSNGKETDAQVLEGKPTLEKDRIVRGKTKLTRTPKSPVLKNLKIRLNVTEVKDLLQLGDDEQEDSSKKLRPGDQSDNGSKCTNVNEEDSNNDELENATLEKKEVLESPKSLISQLELEQALRNIAKLTDPAFPTEPSALPVPLTEVKSDPEEEKPSNPASETELMAAIDSITAEHGTASLPPAAPSSADVGSEPEIPDLILPTKENESETNVPAIPEEAVFPATLKKGTKGRPKRCKGQKQGRKDSKEGPSTSEELTTPLSDSPPSGVKTVSTTTPSATTTTPSATTTTPSTTTTTLSATTAAVITATTWKPEPEPLAVKVSDVNSESSSEDQIQHLKSVTDLSRSQIGPTPQQMPPDCISPSLSPLANRPNIRPIQTSRIPVSPPDWRHQSKDTGLSSSLLMPLASKENQSIPPDSENMDIDHGTSDLRQILMKHKNISCPGSSSIPSNLPTLRDQNPSESNTPSAGVANKSPLSGSGMATHPAPPIVRAPASLPSSETKSVISVIASTATSVISRVCNPPEPEDKVNINLGNPCVDSPLPKPAYRPSKDDTGSYHGPSVGDGGGSAAHFIVESPTLGPGSCPGLRVNTSEGVVVLSHSGQKTEGPQRISAKISQIPQATAGDMESQQLVSMPQIKQEMYGHSHVGLQKGPSLQADHGHPGKMQSTLSSIKQESTGLEKMESNYQSTPQGVVKRLTQGNQQVMSYHPEYMPIKHQKKMDSVDPHSTDGAKPTWTSAISPAISPHLPSPPGNHVGFAPAPGDRATSHISGAKQEPRSPRKSGHPHTQFTKVSSPGGSSSPKGTGMLSTGLPAMQQFITGVHHAEQSVIMPPLSGPGGLGRMSPHRVNQSIPVGHLVQSDGRVNTPPLSVMSYGMHSEPLASQWSGPIQSRPTSPQAVGRDKVLKVNPGSLRGHDGEQDEARRFHQASGRQSAPQLKPETIQSDPRGSLRSNVQLETYMTQRDMRVLLQQQGESLATDTHSGIIQETLPPSSAPSSLPLSLSPRAHVLPKGVSEKDITKPLEAKRPHSPLPKDGMMGIRQSGQAMASPQRVQLMPPGPSGSFPEYTGMYSNPRGIHSQIPESSPVGPNQPPPTVTPSMGADPQTKPDGKPVNMVQLLTKYPIVWQGLLALKNDTAAVQLHFVCGNKALAHRSLPLQEGGALLRIVQRMRLEASQLESVARRMTVRALFLSPLSLFSLKKKWNLTTIPCFCLQGDSDFCLLLALPCGRDQDDVLNQTQALKAAFINYLQAKLAAGIINIPNPGSNQPAYVLQIFPPCEFSESHLSQLAPDLLNRISSISPHLMIVITSV